jgi:hypothetical protein
VLKKCIFVSVIVITLSFCNICVYYGNKGGKKGNLSHFL